MYLILAAESEDLQEKFYLWNSSNQVTNLTLIENNFDDKYNYQIVDRNTVKPIKMQRFI
jgi:hypothetical protein